MLAAAKLSSRAIFVLSSATVQLAAHCLLAEAACLLLPQLACHVCVCAEHLACKGHHGEAEDEAMGMSTAELAFHHYKADKHKALFENLACDCVML